MTMTGITAAQNEPDSVRPIDPNVLQRKASDPGASVWVSASAGTGKTKVLTDRVLRLLLPRADGTPGTPPHKILCLTFTKAAASEMALRLSRKLSEWAVAPEADLQKELSEKILGRAATPEECAAARQLFAGVLDVPGGLKIMTIHAFCQSILGRFPLEAGVSPHFEALEESESRQLLDTALLKVMRRAEESPGSPLSLAAQELLVEQNEEQLRKLLLGITSERGQLETLMTRFWNADGLRAALFNHFGLSPNETEEQALEDVCDLKPHREAALRHACAVLSGSKGKTDIATADHLHLWLNTERRRSDLIEAHMRVFLKSDGEIRETHFPTKRIVQNNPEVVDFLRAESRRLYNYREKVKALRCINLTCGLFLLGHEITQAYQEQKTRLARLDYDDMILKTLALLESETMPSWVLYKLDQGVDHILVDEAQDTNPEQWRIIEALCSEFFSGAGAREADRSLFVVGDAKQSIYSFQRAAPQEFARMRRDLEQKARGCGKLWDNVPLNISFRTTAPVLELVDAVFRGEAARRGFDEDSPHISYRLGQAGHAELWPLFVNEKPEERDPWRPPTEVREHQSGRSKLARYIAEEIRGWLDCGERLESRDRPVRAGDIMILVRSRNALVSELMLALKNMNIPVSGADRMRLADQIAVEDLLALAKFALLPEDDLTLACALKSPLAGFSEDALFDIACNRKGSLWHALRQSGAHQETVRWLENVIAQGRRHAPFAFFAEILQRPCPADRDGTALRALKRRLGNDCADPVEELLNAALQHEKSQPPALQQFVRDIESSDQEIKREMEEGDGQVRIMTVHGSKGLQAPIVILPDTVKSGSSAKLPRILWPDKTGLELPLWCARKEDEPETYRQAKETLAGKADDEYRRLLYVAMTRAEDRLYVSGCAQSENIDEASWYALVRQGFSNCAESRNYSPPETGDDGSPARLRKISSLQTREADRADKSATDKTEDVDLPGWIHKAAPEEPDPPRPLTPSRPSAPDPVSSPLDEEGQFRFLRGNVTHSLLQFLPDLPQEAREDAARLYVEKSGAGLPERIQANIVTETLSILDDPRFSDLFGPGSRAEVPVTGLLSGNKIVSGQIDRLVVREDEVLIVDYKTNRPAPMEANAIPEMYMDQMRSYRDILLQVYPRKNVRCFLLWTESALMMEVPG